MLLILIFIITAGAIFLLTFGIAQSRQRPRLKLLGGSLTPVPVAAREIPLLSNIVKRCSSLIEPVWRLPYFINLQTQAEVLRININLAKLLLFKVLLSVIIAVLTFTLFSPTYTLLGAFAGFFVPDFFAWNKVKAKKEAIIRIFPEAVDLLDMCINAGADFLSAIKWVVEKSQPNPFIEQLSIVLNEIQVGKGRAQALKDMAARLKLPDISSFVRTIIQSERMGTSIEEAFRNLSEDTRGKRFQAGERYAIKASLKILFPLLFCILPAILIIVAGPIIIKFTSGELIPKF